MMVNADGHSLALASAKDYRHYQIGLGHVRDSMKTNMNMMSKRRSVKH